MRTGVVLYHLFVIIQSVVGKPIILGISKQQSLSHIKTHSSRATLPKQTSWIEEKGGHRDSPPQKTHPVKKADNQATAVSKEQQEEKTWEASPIAVKPHKIKPTVPRPFVKKLSKSYRFSFFN